MRKLNLLLLVACALCAIKASAYDFAVDGIYYALNEDSTTVSVTYETTSYGSYSGDVSIPSTVTYNGVTYTVNALGISSFRLCSGLTSLTLGDSVKTIKDYAFYQFSTSSATGITDFTIPSSITTIGPYAFQGCTGLKSVVIPDNVTVIDKYAFNSCSSVTSLTISSNLTEMGVYAFGNCKALTSIAIPGKLSEISERAFYNCTSLASVTISEGVTKISNYAFSTCSALSSISIPSTLEEIGSQVFYKCTSLDSIDLPQGITTIGSYAFNYCSALTSVSLPSSLTSLGDGAFAHSGLTSIAFPSSLSTLNTNMLNGCTALTSVSLPDSLEEIGSNTFYGCVALNSITIPETVKGIDGSAFYNCSTLTAIKLPEKLEFIGTKAFYSCAAVTEITIPETVDSIATYAFQRCYALKSATIPEGITELRMGLFYDCIGLETVSLPSTLTTIGQSVFRNCSTLTAITIPEKVVSASNYAFYNCTGLTEVNSLNSSPPTLSTSPFATATYSAAMLYVPTGCKDTYAAATYWSNFTNIEEKDFSATTADYTITTAAEWNALADLMATDSLDLTGKVVLIANDIDFTGDTIKPLGYDRVTLFNGELDGNGKTIKGIDITADASTFGCLIIEGGMDAYVHDITVEGKATSSVSYFGGIAGVYRGKMVNAVGNMTISSSGQFSGGLIGSCDSTAVITDCVNKGTITLSALYSGGVIGITSYCTITNCSNEGTVTTTANCTAGVIGYTNTGSQIYYCSNRGTVISSGYYGSGVIGYTKESEIVGCYNDSTGVATLSGQCAGGVIGRVGTDCTATKCFNRGSVTLSGTNSGGTIGTVQNGAIYDCWNEAEVTATGKYEAAFVGYLTTSTIATGCYNTGELNYTGTTGYIAGFCGHFGNGGIYTDCWNSGDVVCADSTVPYVGGFGGCVSIVSGDVRHNFVRCYNTADITGYYAVGGILAYCETAGYVIMTDCWNSGNITSTSTASGNYSAGGIAAVYTKGCTYTSCYNIGKITSSGIYYTGGLFGYYRSAPTSTYPVYITGCWNAGDVVSAAHSAGGIVGYQAEYTVIDSCYNFGNVTSAADYAGGVAGQGLWTMSNVYNTGIVSGADYVGGIVGNTSTSTVLTTGYSTGSISTSGTKGNIAGTASGTTGSDVYYLASNDVQGVSAGSMITYAGLGALELSGWINGDTYSYPRLADNDYARAYAAAVIPADGDSYSSITTGFNVGTPDGVTWTASSGSVEIDGNNVTFSESFSGTLTMTATCGDVSVATELTCNVTVTGISDINGGGREVVEERFYNLAGAQVAEPSEDAKAIYIVVKSYSDGTTETVKEVR